MARFDDLMTLKNDTARGNIIRERVAKILYSALAAEFGDDFTVLLDKPISVYDSDIPKNTVCVDVGDVFDKDDCVVGIMVEVGVKVKSFNTVVTKSGRVRHAVTLDDVLLVLERPEEG